MLLKKGSRGPEVEKLQQILKLAADGIFGSDTEAAVKQWQANNGLSADGMVGPNTWGKMQTSGEVVQEESAIKEDGLTIEKYFLAEGQYKNELTNKEYLFLHHTESWGNPFKVVDIWAGNDSQIATEFLIGGPSIKGNDASHDGRIIQAFPEGHYAWHLGLPAGGSGYMHTHSVGIEVCNFGHLTDEGKAYQGTTAVPSQRVELPDPFRGYKLWHRYSDTQIENLRKLILHIAARDNIDVRAGLVEEIRNKGAAAFDFNQDAFVGNIKGMWTHTNVRKTNETHVKRDMFPQPELMDMLMGL